MTVEEIRLEISGHQIAALRKPAIHPTPDRSNQHTKGKTTGERLLCVHGWLDNANSFVPMFPHLDNFEIVAIDLPGHGSSSHIGAAGHYQLLEAALLLPQIVEALNWTDCHLIGHSLGGNLAVIAACASPRHFSSVVLLEALGPLSEEADELPGRLRKALDHRMNPQRFESRTFESQSEAVKTRLAAAKMTEQAAELIISRQLIETNGGWKWRFDPKHRWASPGYLTEEQVGSLLASMTMETLVIIAEDGYLSSRDITPGRLARLKRLRKEVVPGNHHMHMDDPENSANVIQNFLIPAGAK